MKLESISIRDFRGIEHLDLDFRDELGLIRDIVPIVGPNTSGKTSILDAIALGLRPMNAAYRPRAGLRLSPATLVRTGADRLQVSSNVWFSDDEIAATREVFDRTGNRHRVFHALNNRMTFEWTFPDPVGRWLGGGYVFRPPENEPLALVRGLLATHLYISGLGPRMFQRLGSIEMFDQQRSSLAGFLMLEEERQLGQMIDPPSLVPGNGQDPIWPGSNGPSRQIEYGRAPDPRLILTSLAMRAQVAQDPKATEREDFARLKQLYERVCHPHTIGDLYNTEHGLDIEFHGPQGRYYYDGLSSGQQMILLMLLQFATRRIHRSIVLIDELELHLHPLWQSRLYTALSRLGEDNQYFFTTHSMYLRDTMRDEICHMTGDLAEPAVMG